MSDYTAVAERVLAAIERKGATVTFPGSGGTPPIYDPITDTFSGGTPATDVIGNAIQLQDDPAQFATQKLTLVNPITLAIAASGLGVTPTAGMIFVWPAGGTTYTCKGGEALAPAGVPIYWTVLGVA